MIREQTLKIQKNLADLVKEIDNSLEFVQSLGIGGNSRVVKVKKGDKFYRLKISKTNPIPGETFTLEREYSILKDLSDKTSVTPKAIRFYDGAPALYENRLGKNAYLTEFIEGEILSKEVGQLSEVALSMGLSSMVEEIHKAGYMFSEDADLNADNILLGKDKKLYFIDPMLLVPLREELPFGRTKWEVDRINEIVRRYSFKSG